MNANTSQARLKTKHRILIADGDGLFARRLSSYMWDHGFEAKVAYSVTEARELVQFWRPDTVFVDMLIPHGNALTLCKFINQAKQLKKVPRVVVMSKQRLQSNLEQMHRAGVADFLVKPFSMEDAFRVIQVEDKAPPEPKPVLVEAANKTSAIKELHLLHLFLKQVRLGQGDENGLHNLMRMINMKVKALRTSLIQCVDEHSGLVMASNDVENTQGLKLDMMNYPEIRQVRTTLHPLVIANVRTSDLMISVQHRLRQTPYETLVLLPIFKNQNFFGVLSLRMEQKDPLEIFYIEKFGQVCAQIISLAL
jgi:CheY-like chemotaxis protein